MKNHTTEIFNRLLYDFPHCEVCGESLMQAVEALCTCHRQSGLVLTCGNGGSASDAEHIVGELMKCFVIKRPVPSAHVDALAHSGYDDSAAIAQNLEQAVRAISLVSQVSLTTAFANDVGADMVFAQQVYAYGRAGDVLIGLSTSGNSGNVIKAFKVARTFGVKTIAFTGESGGQLKQYADICLCAPARETFRIQEFHLPLYHALCAMVESELYR